MTQPQLHPPDLKPEKIPLIDNDTDTVMKDVSVENDTLDENSLSTATSHQK